MAFSRNPLEKKAKEYFDPLLVGGAETPSGLLKEQEMGPQPPSKEAWPG